MQSLLKKTFISALGLALFSLPVLAGSSKSLTKSVTGTSYKLTSPQPLHMGEAKLLLKLTRAGQIVKGAKLTAVASMGDGMKSEVKITPKPSGELELKTKFSMGGEWQLTLQQTAPVKAKVVFPLMVSGGDHAGHKM
jgi:hypothetical protein